MNVINNTRLTDILYQNNLIIKNVENKINSPTCSLCLYVIVLSFSFIAKKKHN